MAINAEKDDPLLLEVIELFPERSSQNKCGMKFNSAAMCLYVIISEKPTTELPVGSPSYVFGSNYTTIPKRMLHQVRNIRSAKSPCIDFEISHVFMCQLSTHIKFSKLGQNKVKSALLAAHPQKVACILLLSCLNNQSPFLPFLRP